MRTLAKLLLIASIVIGGLIAAGYAFAPQLLTLVATRVPQDLVEIQSLTIESVGVSQIAIAEVQARSGGVRLAAQGVTAGFELWPFGVRGVDVDRLRLELPPYSESEPSAGTGFLRIPPAALPFPLKVTDLQLRVSTPWGKILLPGSFAAQPSEDGGFESSLQGPEIAAVLVGDPAGRTRLAIRDARDTPLASAAAQLGSDPIEFEVELYPDGLGDWLQRTALVPKALQPTLAPYRLAGERVAITAEIGRDGDLDARLGGRLEVRDARETGQRLFELVRVEAEAAGYSLHRGDGVWSGAGAAQLDLMLDPERGLRAADPSWRWDGAALQLALAQPTLPAQGVAAEALELSAAHLSRTRASGELRLLGLRTESWPAALAPYAVDGNWSWDRGSLSAKGIGRGSALPEVDWRLNAGQGQGRLEAELSAPVAALEPSLEHYTAGFARALRIRSGELDGHYRLDWTAEKRRSDLQLDVGPLDADLDALAIRGLRIAVRSDRPELEPVTITASAPRLALAAGAVARDLALQLHASRAQIRIGRGHTRLFGGAVKLRPTTIKTGGGGFVLDADLEALSLEQLIALFELESAALSGRVSGWLRFDHDKGHGTALEGDLRGIEPGILRLRLGPELPQAGQFEDLVGRALADFRYEELTAMLRYQPDGSYRIAARILGRNPGVLDGHPIALNPTIEGRLPALFSTFFLTGDFNQAIIEHLEGGGQL